MVTLVEAGPADAPSAASDAVRGPDFLAALGVDELAQAGLLATRTPGGARSPYARGRGLGGSSLVNAMVALDARAELMPGCSSDELDAARRSVAVSSERVADDELGPVDRALTRAAPDTERAVLTRRDGRRHTSADAYVHDAAPRSNLRVCPDTTVDRVVFDGRRAVGVRTAGGDVLEADHVVLCAGAIHSPAILLRSGVDTPGLGDGLQDHPSVTFTLQLRADAAEPGGLVIGSLLRRGATQVLPMNHLGAASGRLAALLVAHMEPVGRAGTVRLASDDPNDHPDVDFALLTEPADVAGLVDAARVGLDLLGRAPFTNLVEAVLVDPSGTPASVLDDDGAIQRWVTGSVGDYVHASGTCAMGVVVDRDGAVAGHDRLAVCDASIFPRIPDVNTHFPTTVLAEVLVARWRRTAGDRRLEG